MSLSSQSVAPPKEMPTVNGVIFPRLSPSSVGKRNTGSRLSSCNLQDVCTRTPKFSYVKRTNRKIPLAPLPLIPDGSLETGDDRGRVQFGGPSVPKIKLRMRPSKKTMGVGKDSSVSPLASTPRNQFRCLNLARDSPDGVSPETDTGKKELEAIKRQALPKGVLLPDVSDGDPSDHEGPRFVLAPRTRRSSLPSLTAFAA